VLRHVRRKKTHEGAKKRTNEQKNAMNSKKTQKNAKKRINHLPTPKKRFYPYPTPQPCSKPGNHAARKLSVELQRQHLRYGGGVPVTGVDRRQNGIVLGLGTSRFHRRQASRSLVGEARAYWRRKIVKSEANQSTPRGITCTFAC
jgi:hypothetical protein